MAFIVRWRKNSIERNAFIVSNDSSLDDDINFAVYLLNRDWSRWSMVWGWFNDIKPGKSKKVALLGMAERKDFIVVIENDWYFFQKDKHVSWSIQALGY